MAAPIPTSTAHLTCLCATINEPGTLLSAPHFPITEEMCHCSLCRHTTGSLGVCFPLLSSPPSPQSLSHCTAYPSSPNLTTYFCSICGTTVFIRVHRPAVGEYWCCLSGIIERDPSQISPSDAWTKDIVRISSHEWISDTIDGGIASLLLTLGSDDDSNNNKHTKRSIPCYPESSDPPLPTASIHALLTKSSSHPLPAQEALMSVRCRCSGVDLLVKRADFTHSAQGLNSRFTSAASGSKYIAMFCACRSCRLQSSTSLMPWTYIPPQNITVAKTGAPVGFGQTGEALDGTTLKHYRSSKDCIRSFCGVCGASVFYWCDERPEVVDLSIGVIRAESGVMAREWVEWNLKEVSWREEGVDGEILEGVLGGGEGEPEFEQNAPLNAR